MTAASVLRFLLGLLISLPAHFAGLSLGLLFCILTGIAPDGPWPPEMQTHFLISFGLWQWLYLVPIARWLHRRRPAVAMGFVLSGLFGLLTSGLLVLMAILRP